MTFIERLSQHPKSLSLVKNDTKIINFIIHGQGVFLFANDDARQPCNFNISDESGKNTLKIEITKTNVDVYKLPSWEKLIDENNTKGLSEKKGAYYWLSLDSQNQKIQIGIGEARIENTIYQYFFKWRNEEERKVSKSFLEGLTEIDASHQKIKPLQLLRDPITNKIPLLIKNTEELTMHNIAAGIYLPKSHLTKTAQQLYDCIAGKHFVLDDKDFPDFSKAIEHSIATPGLWCHERLKQKSTEFDKDKPNILETYLRITLNKNNGESPGIPYVMEIWPVGHFSPIHNHGNANAIIRVLHGKINVKLFAFLCDEEDTIEPFSEVSFGKGDITWISPSLNQIHQLKNVEGNTHTCITIQCYMYDEKDKVHYDYFDYLDFEGNKKQYEPDSDMDFLSFKKLMKQEWKAKKEKDSIFSRSWIC